jgi:hypothetical protein
MQLQGAAVSCSSRIQRFPLPLPSPPLLLLVRVTVSQAALLQQQMGPSQ